MKKNPGNNRTSSSRFFLCGILVIIFISACNPTKYVPEGETLLNKNNININKEGLKEKDLLPYIKQQPNKRIFGTRFYLGLYNLSNIEKEKWPHNWLRKIGEEPVIFDPYAATQSKEQIRSYVASKGYFDGKVTDSVKTEDRSSDVYYKVKLLPPYRVRNVTYDIQDTMIRKLCYLDSINSLIERGRPYDVDILQQERSRFERFIKNQGYYGFSTDYITFRVDSTVGNRQVDIYYNVRNFTRIDPPNRVVSVQHSIYQIKNIYIFPDYVPSKALSGGEEYINSLDTINYKGYYFITSKLSPEIKFDLILQGLYLKPGTIYNVTNTEQTQAHLLSLKVYRLINIFYNESNEAENIDSPIKQINCTIQLTLLTQQSYRIELEGTNSAGNLGGALNLIYQHKNIFHGAELFSVKLKGAYEALSRKDTILKVKSIIEYGIETSLRVPKFMVPFLKTEGFIKKYNPSTTILAAYNYQQMPFFTRTMATTTFGYNWKAGNYREHILNPLQFNLVKLPPQFMDPKFAARIEASSYLAYSYKDVMIVGGGYSYIFNNQKIKKSNDYWFMRVNLESAGNLLSLAENVTGGTKTNGAFNIFGLPFAQYVKTDMDLRYNYIMNDVSSIVYRGFVGIGIPYGNSKAIPFEKQYFGGGANSIRAWQVRSLGPGSAVRSSNTSFLNETADIKLEANAEYRFKLFWILEGALFLEAGNIWTYRKDESRPGAQFRLNQFYKDFAVGTGTGFRFDFSFVIGRIDFGMKLRDPGDPTLAGGSKWIVARRPYNLKSDFTWVLGIGYPF